MRPFDDQTIKDLEFDLIRSWSAAFAIGDTAKKKLDNLLPSNEFDEVQLQLNLVHEFLQIRLNGESFPVLDFEELHTEIKYLPIQNAVLQQEGFVRISRASELVNQMIVFFDKRSQDYPTLFELQQNVYFTTELIDSIEKVFDRKGAIRDEASPLLAIIRQKIASLRKQINKNFEKEMRKFLKDGLLGETREAFLNERRVLTVVSTHKRKITGSVLGASKTGSLTFIEPEINVPLNNELELLFDDERKEIFRILQELTKEIAHHLPLIQGYQSFLTSIDFINAKTKLAIELNACLPGIARQTRIELINAFHPILWKNNKQLQKTTLPQNILLDNQKRMLVISGPNAGGKSITLKTIGLLQLMLQSGMLIPVDPNSKMCFFQQILTDIGDNQSIENELSTYSYRLKRMKYFLSVSNKRTLLLLDEFGTGSDPDLGGALAEVFFEELYQRKSFAVITTHYANIKLRADQLPQAINGSMLFNTETLEPLYRFSLGQPGSSFTFEVAQINGIHIDLIEKAKLKLNDQKVKMDRLLSDLQKEKNYLERLGHEYVVAQAQAQEVKDDFEQRKEKYESRLRQQNESIEKNNTFLTVGKKMKSFIDRYQTIARKKNVNALLLEDIRKYLMLEKSKLEEHKRKENLMDAAKTQHRKIGNKKSNPAEKDFYEQKKIKIGSMVKMIDTKQTGIVEEMKNNLCTVIFGFMKLKVELEKLSFVK